MKSPSLLILISSVWISASASKNCTTPTSQVMNCAGLKLTDCPEHNDVITTLILDSNLLTTLQTDMCKNWKQLRKLSVKNNSLQTALDFADFTFLSDLDLSGNRLTNVNIYAESIMNIDVSSNALTDMKLDGLPWLSVLNISNNQFNEDSIPKLLNSLHLSNKIKTFDISNNQITKLPPAFGSFKQSYMMSLNISRNKLSTVDISNFQQISGPEYSLNLSYNLIDKCNISAKYKIKSLDLSHNLIAKIEANQLDKLEGLAHIDLSQNPLCCLCNETADFINWVKRNARFLRNAEQTRCRESLPPANQGILNITCASSSTTVAPPSGSSTTVGPFTSPGTAKTTTSTSTRMPHVDSNGAKIAAGILCPIIILALIGFCVYLFWYRRRPDYMALNGSQSSIGNMPSCDCLPLLPIRSRPNRNVIIDPEEDNRHIFTEDRLSIVDTLNILCAAKDTKWMKENITGFLDLKIQFIDRDVYQLPYSDFTLIFINGDSSIKDTDLINNFKLLLQEIDKSEIRLLFHKMPDFSKVTSKNTNEFTQFIDRNVRKSGHYFTWDSDNKAGCLLALKTWLHSTNVRQNV